MPKHNQLNVEATHWSDFFQIQCLVDADNLRIRFDEEDLVKLTTGVIYTKREGNNLVIDVTPETKDIRFILTDCDNPQTEDVNYATLKDVKNILNSLYYYLYSRREAGPSPHDSWLFNQTKGEWIAPIPKPDDGLEYYWNEIDKTWTRV